MRTVLMFVVVGLTPAFADEANMPTEQPAKFKIMTRRADDAVEVRVEKDRTVFSVKSPFGISQAGAVPFAALSGEQFS